LGAGVGGGDCRGTRARRWHNFDAEIQQNANAIIDFLAYNEISVVFIGWLNEHQTRCLPSHPLEKWGNSRRTLPELWGVHL